MYHTCSLPIHPCSDSEAGIGIWFATADPRAKLQIYKHHRVGIFYGRYLLELSIGGISWCNFYATGCGG